MNPLDLPGPQFLGFYLLYGVAALIAARMARRLLVTVTAGAGAGGDGQAGRWLPGWLPREEDAYAIARLRAGRTEAGRTLLGFLLAANLITIEKQAVKRPPAAPVTPNLMPIERDGLAAIGGGLFAPTAAVAGNKVTAAIGGHLAGLERDLASAGVAWPAERQAPFRWLRNATALAILGLGLAKLLVAMLRGRPNVGILIAMLVVYAAITAAALAPPFATPAGKRYLEWLRQSHAGLLSQLANGRAAQPRQVALAAAIFGLGKVPPLAPLAAVLRPQAAGGGGDGSSCGSGCGGGGGCGGCGS